MSAAPQPPPKFRAVAPGAVRIDGETWGDALIGGRCRRCGTVTFTQRAICPSCWQADTQEPVELSRRGTFYAHTIVRNPPPGAAGPYAIAYVDLPEKLRIMVRSDLETVAHVAPGMEVAIAIAPIGTDEDGATLLGPVLRRAEAA
ncbi:MAG TPA: OB-fold domain-containing protein [Stellaceae bacterium]|nr:OB-fold domain-containing protein [Stellaceae bacterium]